MRFNDWPLMDGALIPPMAVLFDKATIGEAFIDSLALVQFNHRLVAYGLLALAVWHMLSAGGTAYAKGATVLLGLVTAQAVIGVVTLVLVVPLWRASCTRASPCWCWACAVACLCADPRAADAGGAGRAGRSGGVGHRAGRVAQRTASSRLARLMLRIAGASHLRMRLV